MFAFVQLDFPGRLGLDDGRYLIRDAEGEPSEVLVVATLGAVRAGGRRRRRARSRTVERGAEPEPVEVTRLTVVTTEDLGGPDAAAEWLQRAGGDREASDAYVERAMRVINEAVHAHAAAAQDPYAADVAAGRALATRLGYGEGEQVADGRWSDARELIAAEPRRRRGETLQPAERVAEVLGGRERVAPSETLLLRARLDLDQGRLREAAVQLDAGVAALLAEGGGGEDLEALREAQGGLERAAREARSGELDPAAGERLEEILRRAERALRRRRLGREDEAKG